MQLWEVALKIIEEVRSGPLYIRDVEEARKVFFVLLLPFTVGAERESHQPFQAQPDPMLARV
jgi:hypothetical protein